MLAKLSTQSTHPALFHLRAFFFFLVVARLAEKNFHGKCWEPKNIFPSDTQSAILLLPGFFCFLHCLVRKFSFSYTHGAESCAESTENVELLFISLCFPFFFCVRFRLRQSTNYSTLFCSTVRSDLMSFPSQLSFAIIARNKTIEDDFPKSGTKKPQF